MQFGASVDNALEELHAVLIAKRRKTADHFVYKVAETPPVDLEAVSDLFDDFWGQILGSAADGGGDFLIVEYFGKAEVGELDVARLIEYHVFGLETVSMNDYSR